MKKKQFKIKFENGQIKPLEKIDVTNDSEGIVFFYDFNNTDLDSIDLLSDIANESFKNTPQSELNKLPVDGSENHDYYIYRSLNNNDE